MSNNDRIPEIIDNIFGRFDPLYERIGLYTTPVKPGTKKPLVSGWRKHSGLAADERAQLRSIYPSASIGLLAGTMLSNGNLVGFLDGDHSGFKEFLCRATNPVSGKIGQKGLTVFCQFEPGTKSRKIRQKDANAPILEIMATSGMTVLPPSLHVSGNRYHWHGKPLYEVAPSELPVITGEQLQFIRAVCANPAALTIANGGADLKAHDLMLSLTASGIAMPDLDLSWMAHCLNGLLPPGYQGNTAEETLGMLQSAKEKKLGRQKKHEYDPGDVGPVPMGYLGDGRFVFYEQTRRLLIVESSGSLIGVGGLLNLAPEEFWMEQFPTEKGFNSRAAGVALMALGRSRGGFDESRVRGRGVYIENGKVIRNLGDELPPSTRFVYVCHIPLQIEAGGREVEPAEVLEFLKLFNFTSPSAPYLLFGWLVSAVICGALNWRTHVFITGAKNTGKTTLYNAVRSLIDGIVVALDGQSTEAGIRQKLGPDSRPVMLEEFESDQNVGRMRQVIKLIRSSSSGNVTIARGTPEGKALEFLIRASFLLTAINAMAVTAADRSRTVNLALSKHDDDKDRSEQIFELSQRLEGTSASWCLRAMDLTADILASIKMLESVFPQGDLRHRTNMSTLLGSAWTMLNGRAIDKVSAELLIGEHLPFIQELAEAHEQDDATECLNALLEYRFREGDSERLLGEIVAEIKTLSSPDRDKRKDGNSLASAKAKIERFGLKWVAEGLVVANTHRGLSEVFKGTLWETGNWGDSLKRLPGASGAKQRRFGGVKFRSLGTFIPKNLIPDVPPLDEKF